MERSGYDSDMSDKQWENLQKYLPEPSTRGSHLRKWDQRIIINAILYVVTTGCQNLFESHFIRFSINRIIAI